MTAMIFIRPTEDDLAQWPEGWRFSDMRPVFDAIESRRDTPTERGSAGPVRNGPTLQPNSICQAFIDAAVQAGFPRTDDFSGAQRAGAGWYDLSIDDAGERADSAAAYLRPIEDRENLTVRTDAQVTKIAFDGTRAVSLIVHTTDGSCEEIVVEGELLLCAGAIDSPALLLRSGVGDREQLRDAGVAVTHHLPGVGDNLHDHPAVPLVWSCERALDPPRSQFFESALVVRKTGSPTTLASYGHLAYLPPEIPEPATVPRR